MDTPITNPTSIRELTDDELDLISAGARFNPQPDPPGIVSHNPPAY